MVLETVANLPVDIVLQMGNIVLWLQALGIITLILLISTIISIFSTFRRIKREKQILIKLESIEKKINRLSRKR